MESGRLVSLYNFYCGINQIQKSIEKISGIKRGGSLVHPGKSQFRCLINCGIDISFKATTKEIYGINLKEEPGYCLILKLSSSPFLL